MSANFDNFWHNDHGKWDLKSEVQVQSFFISPNSRQLIGNLILIYSVVLR